METCEICGKNQAIGINIVEGARMSVCKFCSYHGKPVQRFSFNDKGKQQEPEKKVAPIETEDVIEGFGRTMHNAREKKGMTLKELGQKINETEGFLDHIEKEQLRPTIKIAQKIEKELHVRLIETTKEVGSSTAFTTEKFKEPTLLDMLQNQLKKKK